MYATPASQETIRAEKEVHQTWIATTAHIIHVRRHLMAEGDPYQRRMIEETPAAVLAQRDWLLAESLVNQGNPDVIQALHHSYAELLAKKYGSSPPLQVYPGVQQEFSKTA